MPERTPEERELIERIWWLIQFRWVALGGVLAAMWLAREGLGVELTERPLYLVLAGLGLLNLFFTWDAGRVLKGNSGDDLRVRFVQVFANVQIALDLAALTLLLHFAGGISNPFMSFYIFHIIIASILLSRRAAYMQAGLAMALFVAMAVAEYAGWIRHYPLGNYADLEAYRQMAHLLGDSFVVASTLAIAVFIATSLTTRLRQRRARIVQLMQEIERKADELQAANEKLLALDKLKTEFLLRVTHELRSPLAAIQSNLGIVMNGYLGPVADNQKELLERADHRAKGLLQLINELLDLSRMKSGSLKRRPEPLDAAEILREIIGLLKAGADEKSIAIHTDIAGEPLMISGDREPINELFTNLIGNAIKYTPDGGQVTVAAFEQEERLIVRVSDTGIGIGVQDLPHIFEEFYRTQRARSVDREGTGLGLAIAKQIAELHGGTVTVSSQEGQGSTFEVILPAPEAGTRSNTSVFAISA
ncbi:MAG: HAMP domain-containing histidine kinase [Armatimonadetes bacterium]|nr:HAMP domain-containing histidine kinase [Armatimonadota bacterium]